MQNIYDIYTVDTVTGKRTFECKTKATEAQIKEILKGLQLGYCEDEHPTVKVNAQGNVIATSDSDYAYAAVKY